MPAVVPLVMMGVSAAAGAYSAHKQSEAAKDAANTQSAAADKGMTLERQQEQERQARLNPYVQAGYQGLYNMSQQANTPRNPMPMFNGSTPGGGWTPQAGQMNLPQQPNRAGGPMVGMTYGSPIGPGNGPAMNPAFGNQPAIGAQNPNAAGVRGMPPNLPPYMPGEDPRLTQLRQQAMGR